MWISLKQQQMDKEKKHERNETFKVAGDFSYNPNQLLGSGTWGSVFKAKHRQSRKMFAIKKMNKFKIQASEASYERYKSEVLSLGKANKIPQVIKFIDFFKSKSSYYIVTEYQEGSVDLFCYMKMNHSKFSQHEAKSIWADLLLGIKSLHELQITHRDLKLQNILYNPQKGKAKIIDFGLATTLLAFEGKVGSPIFMSPQVIKGEKYTNKCDIWSLGIVFYWMVCGQSPYGESPLPSHIVEVMGELDMMDTLPMPKAAWMSKNCEEVIRACLKWEEEDRMEIDQILKMKFFKEPVFGLIYTRWLEYYEPELSFAN